MAMILLKALDCTVTEDSSEFWDGDELYLKITPYNKPSTVLKYDIESGKRWHLGLYIEFEHSIKIEMWDEDEDSIGTLWLDSDDWLGAYYLHQPYCSW